MIWPLIINSLKKIDDIGIGSFFTLAINAALSIMCALSLNVWIYAFFPLEKEIFIFLIWVLLNISGAYLFGKLSDKYSRKNILLITTAIGIFGIFFLKKYGFNLPIIMLLAFAYNPTPIINASLISFHKNFFLKTSKKNHSYQSPKLIAYSVLLQAFPWIFFGNFQNLGLENSINLIYYFSIISFIFSFILFKENKSYNRNKKNATKGGKIFKLYLVWISFLFAESVYFISALAFKGDTFFILAGIGVVSGSILHFLPHKDYHLTYSNLISAAYFLGGLLMLLGVIGAYLMKNPISLKVFGGIIACIGAIYIPLVYSRSFQLFNSKKIGEASGICEGIQGIASIFAPLILEFIKYFHLSFYSIGAGLSLLFFIAFFINVFSVRGENEQRI
ncbi:hypothetical protein [Rhabdochlamydiaceae symbiont of Dictyostelium giganteum]|uniref:hypothetical protein n=1 Tax=Rhabdochlamydiaceae symbiont of Dictyostelium giganteum TaxID=3342349 RepID=UPI00384B357A